MSTYMEYLEILEDLSAEFEVPVEWLEKNDSIQEVIDMYMNDEQMRLQSLDWYVQMILDEEWYTDEA